MTSDSALITPKGNSEWMKLSLSPYTYQRPAHHLSLLSPKPYGKPKWSSMICGCSLNSGPKDSSVFDNKSTLNMTFSCCSPTYSVGKWGSSPCLTHLQLSHQNPLCLTPMNAVSLVPTGYHLAFICLLSLLPLSGSVSPASPVWHILVLFTAFLIFLSFSSISLWDKASLFLLLFSPLLTYTEATCNLPSYLGAQVSIIHSPLSVTTGILFMYYYVPWYMTKWCSERWCHLPKVIELVIDTPGDVKSGRSTSQACALSRHSPANYKQRPHSWSLLPACSATSTCCSGTSSSVVSPAPPWSIIGRWYSSISSSPPCLPLSSESSIKMSLQKHSWRCLSYIRVAKTPRLGAAASMGVALDCP